MNTMASCPYTKAALGPPPPRSRVLLSILLTVGFGLRIWYWGSIRHSYLYTVPFLDSETYDTWARALASGDWGRGQPYWMGPLYPHLLALCYAIFGSGSEVAMLGQWALTLLNIILVYTIGRRWINETGAMLAAVLYSGYGPPVFYASFRLMETVVTTLFLLIALQSWRAAVHPTNKRWLILGLLVGLCATARGSALALLPLLPLPLLIKNNGNRALSWHSKSFLRLCGSLWAGAMLVILPVTARNLLIGGDMVLLTSNAGLNLLIGQQTHHGGRFGSISDSYELDPTGVIMLEQQAGHALRPSQVSRELIYNAIELVLRDPASALKYHLLKTYRFFSGYELPQIYSWNYWRTQFIPLRFFPIPAIVFTALGLAGCLTLYSAARLQWVVLVGGWFLSFLPFFPTTRFRLPIMPLLALSAAAWLLTQFISLYSSERLSFTGSRKIRDFAGQPTLLIGIAIILVVALWPSWSALDSNQESWQCHINMASRAGVVGDRAEVLRAINEAEMILPGLAETPFRLGGLLDKLGDPAHALIAYEKAINRAPGNPFVLYRRAQALAALEDHEEAIQSYMQASTAKPDWANPWHGKAQSLLALNKLAKAEEALRQAAALSPGQPRFRGNLAIFLAKQGRTDEAVKILLDLTSDFPRYFFGWYNLALAYAELGNIVAANQAIAKAVDLQGLSETDLLLFTLFKKTYFNQTGSM